MFKIIWTSSRLYSQYMSRRTNQKSPEEYIPQPTRDVFREVMISSARSKRSDCLSKYRGLHNACVCLDAGSVGIAHHFVDFVLCRLGQEHLLSVIPEESNIDGKKYREIIERFLKEMHEYKINVTSFVGDGLQAQRNVFNPTHEHSIQKDVQWKEIFFVPCWIHRVQLVFTHIYRGNNDFRDLMDNYHDLGIRLRKRDVITRLHRVCPATVNTRWVYLFDGRPTSTKSVA